MHTTSFAIHDVTQIHIVRDGSTTHPDHTWTKIAVFDKDGGGCDIALHNHNAEHPAIITFKECKTPRDEKHTCGDPAQVVPQVMTDDSVAYNVLLEVPGHDPITIGCTDRSAARRLMKALNATCWIE